MALFADEILQDALSEITLRDPTFLERQSVGFPPIPALVERYRATPLFAAWDDAAIEQRLTAGLAAVFESGVRSAEEAGPQGRLAAVIGDSIMDGLAAEVGAVALQAPPRRAEPLAKILQEEYSAKTTPDGVNYLVREKGERWLLVVNAIGIPLYVWSRLLGDSQHDYRILVVESETADLIAGGMRSDADLASDVGRIVAALDAERIEAIDVVGWCSGGRVAVQLAADQPERVLSLALISTSLRGVPGSDAKATQFEEDIGGIFDSVNRAPETGDFLSELLVNSSKLAQPPTDDAMLFRLPAREHASALTAPLSTGNYLRNYCRRMVQDKAHPTGEALSRIRAPILAIAGSHDHIISNDHTWATLKAHAKAVQGAAVNGAGHYAHDLQYPYFRLMLDAFTRGRPFAAARVETL
ncbi:MAG TPA: alpha/beta fold hydrolase [Caulobacteraceae bacterium]|jgi:pimeloyl-ACP methyl ester carboxylesterase|nr:alpha/beta fold hydrolase [Caulobacteraceae bacterium]